MVPFGKCRESRLISVIQFKHNKFKKNMFCRIITDFKQRHILTTVIFFIILGTFSFALYNFLNNDNIRPIETNLINDSFKIVCYYNFPRNGSVLMPEDIPETLCTHIILAFAAIDTKSFRIKIPEKTEEIMERLKLLKRFNKSLKIMISVGGAGCDDFTPMVDNHANRIQFINSTMRFIKRNKFDGVDIDWEWPGQNGNSNEKIKFVQLLQEIRIEFDRHKKKYILSIAAGALKSQSVFYYINYIKLYVDFFNLLTYDYHYFTNYYPITDYNAPLYPSNKDNPTTSSNNINLSPKDPTLVNSDLPDNRQSQNVIIENKSILSDLNINSSVNYWISQLVPKNKLIMGIPTYGHSYSLISSLNHDLHAPSKGFGSIGEKGFVNYPEICKFLSLPLTTQIRDDFSKVPYAYNNYDWISYDDEHSVKLKAEYIVENELGGAMVYSLNTDDYAGSCRKDRTQFPLVKTIKSVFKDNYVSIYDKST